MEDHLKKNENGRQPEKKKKKTLPKKLNMNQKKKGRRLLKKWKTTKKKMEINDDNIKKTICSRLLLNSWDWLSSPRFLYSCTNYKLYSYFS
jgi:hypothetical protein